MDGFYAGQVNSPVREDIMDRFVKVAGAADLSDGEMVLVEVGDGILVGPA